MYLCFLFKNYFNVIHQKSETKAERDRFKGAKYVQSDLKTVFSEIKTILWGLGISGIVFFIFGLFLLIPSDQFSKFAVFAERLRPLSGYIAQISFQTIILL